MKARFHLVRVLSACAIIALAAGCAQKKAEEAPAPEAAAGDEAKTDEAAASAEAKAGFAGLAGVPFIGSQDPTVVIVESSDFQ